MFFYKDNTTHCPLHWDWAGIPADRRGNFKQIVLMSLCFFFAGCINDEDINGSGCFNGKVMNVQGEVLADVNLQLINTEEPAPYNGNITFTDLGGNYTFQEITPADNYLLIATHPDYETDTSSVNIFPIMENECASKDITLSLSPKVFDAVIDAFDFLGERGNSKYYLSKFITTWPQANNMCKQLQVHLVTINGMAENDFLVNILLSYGWNGYWIGLHDAEDEGVFRWVTGEPLDYLNWDSLQPDNHMDNQDFAQFLIRHTQSPINGKWDDLSGNAQIQFIVEWEDE